MNCYFAGRACGVVFQEFDQTTFANCNLIDKKLHDIQSYNEIIFSTGMKTFGDGGCIDEVASTNFANYVAIECLELYFSLHVEQISISLHMY